MSVAELRQNFTYYFTVEGETEQWYLKWLEKTINKEITDFTVTIDCPVEKNPLKYAKKLRIIQKTEVYHLFDYESDEANHVKNFINAMDNMKKAKELWKQIIYKSGYSNLTFDLWMILHKAECNGWVIHRDNYITHINNAYKEKFQDMNEYKHEANFKRCLNKLKLHDVIAAVIRAKSIMRKNKDNGYILQRYKGYTYYKENPSLSIWEAIEIILKDCRLYKGLPYK